MAENNENIKNTNSNNSNNKRKYKPNHHKKNPNPPKLENIENKPVEPKVVKLGEIKKKDNQKVVENDKISTSKVEVEKKDQATNIKKSNFNKKNKSHPVVNKNEQPKELENKQLEKTVVNKPITKPVSVPRTSSPKPGDIRIYSLGGIGVIGMNMYVIEQDDEIMVIDAGILFADDDVHGVNYIIPDFTQLVLNEKKIIGLFITHGHEDHIGAIPFLLQKVNIPAIYASGLAIGLINNKMQEFPNVPYKLKEYTDDSIVKTKHFEISFFRTNHSIPDSFGMAVKTSVGNIVTTGDFKFDFSPVGKPSDYYKMAKLGKEGVYCLLSESTNADIPEFSSSEKKIGETLLSLFNQIEGRILVATFASNVYRVQQIIEASIATGRKVYYFGHSMELTIQVASRLGYINFPKGFVINARDMKTLEEGKYTILCTGSQGEPMAALSRIASGTHKQIKLLPNDTIIYSSKPIPGNEQFVNRNINKLVHAGAHVIIKGPLSDTHTTGHASQNELRLMLSLMKPKYFVPVHGEYLMLREHVKIAESVGIPKNRCFVLNAGDALNVNEKGIKVISHAVPVNDVYLDAGLSDVDSTILKERKKMADDGIVSITYFVDKKKQLINNPVINLNGFAASSLIDKITNSYIQKATDIYKSLILGKEKINLATIEKQITNQMGQYMYQKMSVRPLILVVIKQINN